MPSLCVMPGAGVAEDEERGFKEGDGVGEGNSLLLGATGKKLPEGFGIGLLLGSIVV